MWFWQWRLSKWLALFRGARYQQAADDAEFGVLTAFLQDRQK